MQLFTNNSANVHNNTGFHWRIPLEGLLKLGRALELSEKQAKDVEDTGGEFEAVNKIKSKEENRQSRPRNRHDTVTQSSFWKQARQISWKMWQLWWVRTSQKYMSCTRKSLQSLRKNWPFCSRLSFKTLYRGLRGNWSNLWWRIWVRLHYWPSRKQEATHMPVTNQWKDK